MIPYPTDMPLDAMQVVVDTIRSKSLNKKSEFAEAVWNVQGYAQSKAFGEPQVGFGSPAPLTDEEACEVLEAGPGRGAAIPWSAMAKWALQLALKLL